MGTRDTDQSPLWIAASDLPASPGHPFYARLNAILETHGFDRFVEDPEHTELAWLVTRALWGDLQDSLTPELATMGEELSRALRRRLAGAHPAPVRAIGVVSRLSLRHPYAPELTQFLRKPSRAERAAGARSEKEADRAAVA